MELKITESPSPVNRLGLAEKALIEELSRQGVTAPVDARRLAFAALNALATTAAD